MPGPWEKYASADESAATKGPWEKYASPTPTPTATATDGDKDTSAIGSFSLPGAQQAHNSSYTDIVSNPDSNIAQKGARVGMKALDQFGGGVENAITGIPGMVKAGIHAALPTANLPVPGGQMMEDAGQSILDAHALAKEGKFSEAAKKIPIVGPMYDYAANHPILDTAGYAAGNFLLGKAVEGVTSKVAGKISPEAPPTTFGESPGVKPVIEVLKPTNAKQAIQDYPVVMSRLVREHPELVKGNASLKQISDALDESMMENRHYNEGFTGPVKSSGMKVDLSPISQAIEDSITPLMEKNSPAQVRQLRALAAKYRTKDSIGDLESMLRETNARVTDLNKMNPGDRYNTTTASDSKAVLDSTNKAFRQTYNQAMEKFTGSPAVRALNFEYGKMMGFRQDLEGLVQEELLRPAKPGPTLLGKAGNALNTIVHPKRAIAGAVADAMTTPEVDNVGKLSSAFKAYKGPPAQDYPTPPQYAGPGGGAGSPGNIPQGTYPAATGRPAGTFPGANPGPTAGYTPNSALPSRGRALPAPGKPPLVTPPPADTSGPVPNVGPRPGAGLGQQVGERQIAAPRNPIRPHPGDTYGPNGQGPAVTSERPPEWNGRQPVIAATHDMVKIQTKEHPQGIWVKRSDLKGPGSPLPQKP